MDTLHFFSDYLTGKFGKRLYRIPLDAGLDCPLRASGGCAFCTPDGARARHLAEGLDLRQQVASGIQYIRERYGSDGPYVAYFQSYTPTNAAPATLERIYRDALRLAEFKVLVVATRPDCIPDPVLDLLASLNNSYEVWIELGVQSANDQTLAAMNRGHDFAAVEDAVRRIHARGLRAAAHVILGLPGESPSDFQNTAERIAALPFSAVKVHHLLVLKHTRLAKQFHDNPFPVFNEYEYAAALDAFLRKLPEDCLVMRLSSDAPQDQILAPKWWMKKGQFREMFRAAFERPERREDDAEPECSFAIPGTERFHAFRTNDGSYTLFHPRYKQHFHSVAGAWTESLRKYLQPARLSELLDRENASVLDIGFGLGFNVCAAARLAEERKRGKLFLTSVDLDPGVLDAALSLPEHPARDILLALRDSGHYESAYASIDLAWSDAREFVHTLKAHFDAIFLDGFSPDCNPELWTFDFIQMLTERLKDRGSILTYSSAYPLIGAFLKAGCFLAVSKPFGRKRGGLVASLAESVHLPPLDHKEYRIATESTAGLPYRDPGLHASREEIIERRKHDVARKRADGMPKWIPMKKSAF